MNSGLLLVISAPSGCGKTTILSRVMKSLPGLVFSVSHTTRSPRTGEQHGQEYYFSSVQEFLQLQEQQPSGFLEWAEVHGNFYGTSVAEVHRLRSAGNDVVLDIDVQGAAQVREHDQPVTIFIAPPSLKELERRLRGRGSESTEQLALRLTNARQELRCIADYDYLIVNDNLDEAVTSLQSIIIAERCRQRRTASGEAACWKEYE